MSVELCWTVDDPALRTYSTIDEFKQLLNFLKDNSVPATFFVPPYGDGIPLAKKPEWIRALKIAIDDGHEIQLHGYEHTAFEFGYPPSFILAYEHKVAQEIRDKKGKIEKQLALKKIEERLQRGIEMFEKTMGFVPTGFRSPYLSMHKNTIKALKNFGFKYDSSFVVNPKGWRYIAKDYSTDVKWQSDVPPRAYRLKSGILEIPIISEYTWYLKKKDFSRQLELALEDFKKVKGLNGVFTTLSHVAPMTGEFSIGLKVYERLINFAREQGDVQFCTLSEVIKKRSKK